MKIVITVAVFLALFAIAMATPVDTKPAELNEELQTAEQFYGGWGGRYGSGWGNRRNGYGGWGRGLRNYGWSKPFGFGRSGFGGGGHPWG